MEKIFNKKYIDQKLLVKDYFVKLITNFSNNNKKKIEALSYQIVDNAIGYKGGSSFSKLIHEFSLTSNEGVVLMCLAEALLRIPDSTTINDLIEDKIPMTAHIVLNCPVEFSGRHIFDVMLQDGRSHAEKRVVE